MELENDKPTMELTDRQVWALLRDELLHGLDSGELTEEEFVSEMKTLRTVVCNTTFMLVGQPNIDTDDQEDKE